MTISFTLITDTPGRVRTFLINRGILEQRTAPSGQTYLAGTLPGVEFTVNAVPNPIIVTPAQGTPGTDDNPNPNYVPPVYDDRKVYLVQMSRDAEADQTDGIQQTDAQGKLLDVDARTKLGAFVKNNGARDDINVNGTIVPAWKITNQNIWLARDPQGLFGTWQ